MDPADSATASDTVDGVLVCREGAARCIVVGSEAEADEVAASSKGRGVVGKVDPDLSGTWNVVHRPSKMRCTPATGASRTIKVNRTEDVAELRLRPDGAIDAKGSNPGEPPFVMARLGPGLYGSIQYFSDESVES